MRHLLQGAITFQRRKSLAFRHPSTLQDFWTIFGRCTGARCHACGKIYATCVAAARREETRACLVKIEKSANNKRMRSWHNTCQSSNQKRPRKMHNMRTHPFSERQLNEQKKQDLGGKTDAQPNAHPQCPYRAVGDGRRSFPRFLMCRFLCAAPRSRR